MHCTIMFCYFNTVNNSVAFKAKASCNHEGDQLTKNSKKAKRSKKQGKKKKQQEAEKREMKWGCSRNKGEEWVSG